MTRMKVDLRATPGVVKMHYLGDEVVTEWEGGKRMVEVIISERWLARV